MTTPTQPSGEELLRHEVIARPSKLSDARKSELFEQLVQISALATSNGDPTYRPAFDGWARYYATVGDRPQDYDRLSLAYAGDELVSVAALKLLETHGEPSVDIIWLQLILTAPQHRRTMATTRTLAHLLLDPRFQVRLRGGYIVARTPNPLVYEVAVRLREWGNQNGTVEFQPVLPEIQEDGRLAPIPEQHQAYLPEIVGLISKPEKFQADTFVFKGYYEAFGALYKSYDFWSRYDFVRAYFSRHVQWETQDGLFLIVPFVNRDRSQGA